MQRVTATGNLVVTVHDKVLAACATTRAVLLHNVLEASRQLRKQALPLCTLVTGRLRMSAARAGSLALLARRAAASQATTTALRGFAATTDGGGAGPPPVLPPLQVSRLHG